MLQTPFYIEHDEKLYGEYVQEYGKKNFTEYDKFYLKNRFGYFLKTIFGSNTVLVYDYVVENNMSKLYFKAFNPKGDIDITKYKKELRSLLVNSKGKPLKSGKVIILDLNFEPGKLDPKDASLLGVTVKDNLVLKKVSIENDPSKVDFDAYVQLQVKVKNLLSKKNYIFVGNNIYVRNNISKLIKDCLFCDGWMLSGGSNANSSEIGFALALPWDSGREQISFDDGDYYLVSQFGDRGKFISESPQISLDSPLKNFKFKSNSLSRYLVKKYLGMDYTYGEIRIPEIVGYKIKKFVDDTEYNYICDNPLVFLANKDIEFYEKENMFFYKGDPRPELEIDILNKIRLMQLRGYFWHELSFQYDTTYDLIKEISELYSIENLTMIDRYVIGKSNMDIVDLVIKIKTNNFVFDSKVNVPGKITVKYSGDEVFYQVEYGDRILELNASPLNLESIQTEWESGKMLSNWAKYYLTRTGKISVWYLK